MGIIFSKGAQFKVKGANSLGLSQTLGVGQLTLQVRAHGKPSRLTLFPAHAKLRSRATQPRG